MNVSISRPDMKAQEPQPESRWFGLSCASSWQQALLHAPAEAGTGLETRGAPEVDSPATGQHLNISPALPLASSSDSAQRQQSASRASFGNIGADCTLLWTRVSSSLLHPRFDSRAGSAESCAAVQPPPIATGLPR
jgi:hypothetical protein